jgi:hypothetical protein
MSFYHSAGIIDNVFDNILIPLFKMKNQELLEAGIYRLNPERHYHVFR